MFDCVYHDAVMVIIIISYTSIGCCLTGFAKLVCSFSSQNFLGKLIEEFNYTCKYINLLVATCTFVP